MMYYVATKTEVSDWLEQKFLEWRASNRNRRAGVTQFAEYLGLSRDVLNSYLSRGSKPDGENLEKIAGKLGDEIYALVGKTPPDPLLRMLIGLWSQLNDETKRRLAEDAARYAANGEREPSKRGQK